MKVRLHTVGKKFFNEEQWAQIHDALQFYVDAYSLDKYDVPVDVLFPDKLDLSTISGGAEHSRGLCITEFRQFATKFVAKKFIIKIAPTSLMKVVETIFHEMTHVMQELRGDFVRRYDGSEVYRGVHYSVDKLQNPTYKEYRAFPWEVEARQVSEKMLKEWKASRKIKQTFWQKFVDFWS